MIRQTIIGMASVTLILSVLIALGPNIAVIFPIALIVFAPLPPMAYLTIVRRKLGRVPYERGSTSIDRMLSALFVVTLLSTAVMLVVGVAQIRTTFNRL